MHPRTRELMDHLDSQRAILRAAFDAVPAGARDRPPAPDRWSPAEIVEHLALVEQRVGSALAARIASARAEGLGVDASNEPVLPTLDLERVASRRTRVKAPETSHPSGLDAETAWAALERAGTAVRETLRSADGLALGTITHPHPFFGSLSLYEWFALIGSHEARHAAQIREIVELSAAQSPASQPS
jgi:DinB superfamily